MQKFGIVIMSVFAAIWFVWGLSAISPVPGILLAVPLIVSGAMIGFALRRPASAFPSPDPNRGKIIGWASFGEGIAILVAVNVLGNLGLSAFSPCAVLAIVGLHFIPLGHQLHVPAYYASAAAMVVLAVAACAVPDEHRRLLTAGLGGAAILWITCLTRFSREAGHQALPA
jgi:hypothetical protein